TAVRPALLASYGDQHDLVALLDLLALLRVAADDHGVVVVRALDPLQLETRLGEDLLGLADRHLGDARHGELVLLLLRLADDDRDLGALVGRRVGARRGRDDLADLVRVVGLLLGAVAHQVVARHLGLRLFAGLAGDVRDGRLLLLLGDDQSDRRALLHLPAGGRVLVEDAVRFLRRDPRLGLDLELVVVTLQLGGGVLQAQTDHARHRHLRGAGRDHQVDGGVLLDLGALLRVLLADLALGLVLTGLRGEGELQVAVLGETFGVRLGLTYEVRYRHVLVAHPAVAAERPAADQDGADQDQDTGRDQQDRGGVVLLRLAAAALAVVVAVAAVVRVHGRQHRGGRGTAGVLAQGRGRLVVRVAAVASGAEGRGGRDRLAVQAGLDVGAHLVRRLVPVVGVLDQRLQDDGVHLGRALGAEAAVRRRLLAHGLVGDGDRGVAHERRAGGQQLVEQAAGGVEGGAGVDLFAFGLFGGEVLGGADHGRRLGHRHGGVAHGAGDAEVHDLDLAVA